MDDYSLSDLTEITGLKRRTVQHWSEVGAIVAEASTERKGTGVHRRFSRREAMIACLLAPYGTAQISIGQLLPLSMHLRDVLSRPGVMDLAEKCARGEARAFFTYALGAEIRTSASTSTQDLEYRLFPDEGDGQVEGHLGAYIASKAAEGMLVTAVELQTQLRGFR